MLIGLITLLALVTSIVRGQFASPCPEVLRYENRKTDEHDRWYAEITLGTDEALEGVWIRIVLDREAELLGNWFSEAVSKDNIVYSIRDPQYRLEPGPPIVIRFFVKYNVAKVVPTVKKILLNGKTVCPRSHTPTEPTLHISGGRPTINNHNENQADTPQRVNSEPDKKRPLSVIEIPSKSSDDDDVFQGDFAIHTNNRPNSRPVVTPVATIQCGTIAQRPSPLISYGQNTTPGQWPWHTALYVSQTTELKYTCGGTLITDKHVVTAAHCVTKPRTTIVTRKDKFVIYLGKYNLISFGGEVQDRQIETITVHPDYNATVYFNDIAILKLEAPVVINDYVRPCCLWEERDSSLENIIGQRGTVVGWGFNEDGQLSRNLIQTQMPIVSTSTCLFSNRNFFSQFINDKNFCAGFRNDTSVCNGDSGGGMVFPKRGTSGENTVWQLRGIISLGVARQSEAVCDPKQYSIFTDAAQYITWIKQTIAD